MQVRLTETIIKKTNWNGKEQRLSDTSLPGFFVSINKRSKTFKIKADLWVGDPGRKQKVRTITHAIGSTEKIELKYARAKATAYLNNIKMGIDPFRTKDEIIPNTIMLGQLINSYIDDRKDRDRREGTIAHYKKIYERYVKNIGKMRISEFEEADTYALHKKITRENGPVVANQTIKLIHASYKFGRRRARGQNFPRNPAAEFEYNSGRKSALKAISRDRYHQWYMEVRSLKNPLRQEMHLLCLYSGLRKRTLTLIERDWIDTHERAIKFPTFSMKSGRDFHLPLSHQMVACLERAMEISEIIFPSEKWLFATYSKQGNVQPITTIREKRLSDDVGHVLRRSHKTVAQRLKINDIESKLLLDHKVPGISGVYVDNTQLFDDLLIAQQKISDEIDSYIQERRL